MEWGQALYLLLHFDHPVTPSLYHYRTHRSICPLKRRPREGPCGPSENTIQFYGISIIAFDHATRSASSRVAGCECRCVRAIGRVANRDIGEVIRAGVEDHGTAIGIEQVG